MLNRRLFLSAATLAPVLPFVARPAPGPVPVATVSIPVFAPCRVEILQFTDRAAAFREADRSDGHCVELPDGSFLVVRDRDLGVSEV